MSTRGTQLISRIVRTGEIEKTLTWGITAEDFPMGEDRAIWDLLYGFYANPNTRGSVIGPEKAGEYFPTLTLCDDPGMSLEALCQEVRMWRIQMENDYYIRSALSLNQTDPLACAKALMHAGERGTMLATAKSVDVTMATAMSNIMHRYDMRKAGVDFSIASWPWDALQRESGGMQEDDYVIFYGRPKSKKSWVLAALLSWLIRLQKPLLIYTKEMTAENIFQRIAAVLAMVAYTPLRLGKLDPAAEDALRQVDAYIRYAEKWQQIVCVRGSDVGEEGDTVPWLQAKIKQHKPAVVAVDGIYLMSDSKRAKDDHARVRNISRGLRQCILDTGVPIVGTMQATRGAAQHKRAELDEIAFSDALSQDCTLAMRTINDKRTSPDAEETVTLKVAGARELNLEGMRIYAVPATNFNYKEELTIQDLLEAEALDSAQPPKKKTRSRRVEEEEGLKAALAHMT